MAKINAEPPKGETSSNPAALASSGTFIPKDTIASAKTWDIYSPPPSNTIKGSLVPNAIFRLNPNRRRRISLEIHRVYTAGLKKKNEAINGTAKAKPQVGPSALVKQATQRFSSTGVDDHNDYYEECFVRLLVPENAATRRDAKKSAKAKKAQNGLIFLNPAAEEISALNGGDDDDSTVAGAFADKDDISNLPSYEGWRAKYKLPINTVTIKSVHKKDVLIVTEYGHFKHSRDLIFDSEQEAKEFAQMIEMQKEAGQDRAKIKLMHALGGLKITPSEELTLLVEIVSGTDLPVADLSSSDPLVVCFFNDREVHRTDFVSKNLNPVWTVKTGSLFLLTVTTKELFMSDGLMCEVADFDTLGPNEILGAIILPPKFLYEAKGERTTYKLQKSPHGAKDYGKGSLSVRVRHATTNDKQFMKELEESDPKKGKQSRPLAGAGGKSDLRSLVERVKKTEKLPNGATIKKYRVRPHPDPKRKEQTSWMSKQQIETEVMKESTDWLDTGSGDVARIFIEILGCNGLPNLDSGGFMGNKTDAFVGLVFEDTWAQTDVIDDCLSPRWLPWMKRAFIFHQSHSSSQLFLGVFDHDIGLDDHDLIGRVSVDLSNLRANTMYTLTYDIFPTARMTERKSKGTITLRLRMEIDDERKLLTCCLEPPRTQYVNVKKRKEFKTIKYTCTGKYDMDGYNMKVLTSYIEELSMYNNLRPTLEDAVKSLLFWRSQFDVELNGKKYGLPLHSFTAFVLFALLVEKPIYIPSFCFASVSWTMLAIMFHRRHNPNPWRRCKSFVELFLTLATGKSGTGPDDIIENQNIREALAFEERVRKRIEDAEIAAAKAAAEAEEEQAQAEKDQKEIGEAVTDISAKTGGGISIDPLKRILEPIQRYLQLACKIIRYIRNILIWDECYLAFWLTVGCFAMSIACMFVPWAFLIQWTSRVIAWTLFGPWMKLVDVYYYSKIENMTEEEYFKQKQALQIARQAKTGALALKARIDREDAQKLKDMKTFLFGKFILKVPVLKEDRWRDIPLPQSKAEPYKAKPLALAELAMQEAGYHRTRVGGQHLEGVMIPTIEMKAFTEAPIGQATKLHAEKESDSVAYAKICSIVVGAAAITWFGVPFVASMAQLVLGG